MRREPGAGQMLRPSHRASGKAPLPSVCSRGQAAVAAGDQWVAMAVVMETGPGSRVGWWHCIGRFSELYGGEILDTGRQ